MDQPASRNPWRRAIVLGVVALAALVSAAALWSAMPRGLQVASADLRIATVTRGMFRDDLAVRAIVTPVQTVMLDAVEAGRVEEVFARDGAMVAAGEPLFRLSNPQRRLELLARQAEHAQQLSNLTTLRVALQAGIAQRQRRLDDIAFAQKQVQKRHARNAALAAQGFLSAAAMEDSADQLKEARRALQAEAASNTAETGTQRDAVRQMEHAIARLEAGLAVVNGAIEALVVRASAAGRLADFHPQVGETIVPGRQLGRIDDLRRFKAVAQVDEYYLARVAPGRSATAVAAGQRLALTVSRVQPQIRDGRFEIELAFGAGATPALNPGQSLEATIALGEPAPALLLPNDAFLNDGGGAWVFVLRQEGLAERRPVRIGRRNHAQVEILGGLVQGERVIVSSYARFSQAERLQLQNHQ